MVVEAMSSAGGGTIVRMPEPAEKNDGDITLEMQENAAKTNGGTIVCDMPPDSTTADNETVALLLPDKQAAQEDKCGTAQEEADCRICLMTSSVADLITPCACTGSVQYVHAACLERWCRERGSLRCEICHSTYEVQGTQLVDAAHEGQAEQAAERERQRQLRQLQLGLPNGMLRRTDQDLILALRDLQAQASETDEGQERTHQVRRLVLFAIMVTVTMIMFHLLGSILLVSQGQDVPTAGTEPAATEHTEGTTGAETGEEKKGVMGVMNRLIRAFVFFYIIRSLFIRHPNYDEPDMHGPGRRHIFR